MTQPPETETDEAATAAEESAALDASTKPNLNGDRLNFLLLLSLYTMQGVNFGVSVTAIPIILQSKNTVTFNDQALFSLSLWPNSIKILWAPIIDAVYVQRIGRRKSWLLPVQFTMGVYLIYLASRVDGDWLAETGRPNIESLTCAFFVLNFLSATLDVVYSSWTVTLLKKVNVGFSSASKSSGIAIGIMIGSVVPVLLSSEEFCNRHLRTTAGTGGVATIGTFLIIWGVVLVVLAMIIGVFKKEKDVCQENSCVRLGIVHSYRLLWDILRLPNSRLLLISLFTMQIGLSAMRNSLTNLKLVDAGVPKDDIMLMTTAMFAVKILTPLVVSKYTSGPKPMSLCMKAMLIRLLWSLTFIPIIYYTPMFITNGDKGIDVPLYYYFIIGFSNAVNDALTYYMLVAMTSFFTRISDSRFSGTYMTLLNTLTNLGVASSSSLGLKAIDYLTIKDCSSPVSGNISNTAGGVVCTTTVDGYYVEIVMCVVIGFVWYGVFKNTLEKFQIHSPFDWIVYFSRPNGAIAKVPTNNCTNSKSYDIV